MKTAVLPTRTRFFSYGDAVCLFLREVVLHRRIPFEVRIPNTLTWETSEKAEEGVDLHPASGIDELFKERTLETSSGPAGCGLRQIHNAGPRQSAVHTSSEGLNRPNSGNRRPRRWAFLFRCIWILHQPGYILHKSGDPK